MRLSATDPEGHKYVAYLNGTLVPYASWADTEEGTVCVYVLGEDGRAVLDLVTGRVQTEILTGMVTLEKIKRESTTV